MFIYKKISKFMIKNFEKLCEKYDYDNDFIEEFYNEYAFENLQKNFQEYEFIIKSDDNDEIIGIISHGVHSEKSEISCLYWIFVDEKYFWKWVSKKLFDKYLEKIWKNFQKIYSASLKENIASVKFHEKYGFNIRWENEVEIFFEKIIKKRKTF